MIAHRCLIAGFVGESHLIDKSMVKRARESLFGEKFKKIKRMKRKKYDIHIDGEEETVETGVVMTVKQEEVMENR
jgi:membrane protein implicated in regulation of membrane protease activity